MHFANVAMREGCPGALSNASKIFISIFLALQYAFSSV
jgi:hypothetical protein